jgi:hypothetical protein
MNQSAKHVEQHYGAQLLHCVAYTSLMHANVKLRHADITSSGNCITQPRSDGLTFRVVDDVVVSTVQHDYAPTDIGNYGIKIPGPNVSSGTSPVPLRVAGTDDYKTSHFVTLSYLQRSVTTRGVTQQNRRV